MKETTSEIAINESGALELSGSKKKQKADAIEYVMGIQYEISNLVNEIQNDQKTLKEARAKIKVSPIMVAIRELSKKIKEAEKLMDELASRRAGALGLCKKQGIEIGDEIKNIKMIENE